MITDTLTQEDFYGSLQKFLERYKCIAAGGDYFERDTYIQVLCVLSIKVPRQKNV